MISDNKSYGKEEIKIFRYIDLSFDVVYLETPKTQFFE